MITVRETDRPFFLLSTDESSYAFKVMANGQLEHLYYGRRIEAAGSDGLCEQWEFAPGNTSVYNRDCSCIAPEAYRYELATAGKGDMRETAIEAEYADGLRSLDFVYSDYEIVEGKTELEGLPSSYGGSEDCRSLKIKLKDRNGGLEVSLLYSVFEKENVITRSMNIHNASDSPVRLMKAMSAQLDLDPGEYVFHSFTGAWTREMKKTDTPINSGSFVIGSVSGSSSSRANPFVMISRRGCTENGGECYGFHLVYSGNHMEVLERGSLGKYRFVSGINPRGFEWKLKAGESFQTPEVFFTYSAEGFGHLSRNLHGFIREHIVRGTWKKKARPVLLNSWEACYFDISENKLLRLARMARSVGIELLVMDDGWFGKRNDDTSSLGDWYPDKKKLPGGLKSLADKLGELGLGFGIWVEPEMVNEDSELYRAHPDWAFRHEAAEHSTGRGQMFLDLTRRDVQDHVIEMMKQLFSSADISYVKWDMNRNFTDCFAKGGADICQGETAHRYMLGLYRILKELTGSFPDILFEGCASGGNRFDTGMLCYFPQIWASDDTDAVARAEIQNGYSYGYPMSCVTAHVSDVPNHQTLRRTPLDTRFNVASCAVMGYECNLADMGAEELEEIRSQIKLYKEWREVFQYGDLYRGRIFSDARGMSVLDGDAANEAEWTVVAADKSRAVFVCMQLLARPDNPQLIIHPAGLDEKSSYTLKVRDIRLKLKDFGGLVNAISPVHIRQDGALHSLMNRFVKMNGESEEHSMSGGAMMYAGVRIKSSFAGTGYNENVRFYPDFASRIYLIEKKKNMGGESNGTNRK
ncbi:MAG: alpha-galactosidase [Lachnospiraceae bacterium]|nr:alpha-galactosidase [Lachnospiraceae bacterium]